MKNNASKYSEKIKSKGYKTVLTTKKIQSKNHLILIESFRRKPTSIKKQSDLKAAGLNSIIRENNKSYSLELGPYRTNKESNSIVDKLKQLGFNPKIKQVLIQKISYTVRIQGISTKTKAQEITKELARFGFKNSFIG